MKRLENKHIWLALDTSDFFKGETVIRGGAQNHLCPMINTKPHTDTEKVWGEIEAIFHEQTGLSDIAKLASITASATFCHSASPDNVTCWHIMALQ